jgi:hypothetical protein
MESATSRNVFGEPKYVRMRGRQPAICGSGRVDVADATYQGRTMSSTNSQAALDRKRTQTAYHEAGHAVSHALHGVHFDHVSIVPDAETYGRVRYHRWEGQNSWPSIAGALAGPLASYMFCGARGRAVGGWYDYDDAVTALCEEHEQLRAVVLASSSTPVFELTRLEARGRVDRTRPHVRRFLTEVRPAVESVARALLARDQIGAGRVESLVEAFKRRNPEFSMDSYREPPRCLGLDSLRARAVCAA